MGRPVWFPDWLGERPEGDWYRPASRAYLDLNGGTQCCPFTSGTFWDLADAGIEPEEGLVLAFYMDDGNKPGERDNLLFSGVVHRDPQTGDWSATVDTASFRHESDFSTRSADR